MTDSAFSGFLLQAIYFWDRNLSWSGPFNILSSHHVCWLICECACAYWVGNKHPFTSELLAAHHLPTVLLRTPAFPHHTSLLYAQTARYGQPHLACNQVSISNTISAPHGSMLLQLYTWHRRNQFTLLSGSFMWCRRLESKAEVVLLRQEDRGGKMGGGILWRSIDPNWQTSPGCRKLQGGRMLDWSDPWCQTKRRIMDVCMEERMDGRKHGWWDRRAER